MTICIVTCDIVGPVKNGGIGTAYYSLARLLAEAGHAVTVLYAPGRYCEHRTIDHWIEDYRRMGITFVPVPDDLDVRGHGSIRMSHAVYRWLRGRTFDVVHVHEWRGLAFYALLAKRQGLALQQSIFCVGAHSPVLWHREGMREFATAEELEVDFMERQSVALADVLWSPSRHMLEWMRREGWRLPRRIVTRQYVVLDDDRAVGARRGAAPVRELVFFGRLETRKGLDIFCDALDRLVGRGVAVPRVTFLGKPAAVGGVPSEEYLRDRSARWPFPWQIIGNRDRHEAMAYLAEPGRLAVLPSRVDNLPYTVLECLAAGVPFIASNTGGIPEMIRDEDRASVLFDLTPAAMADHLARTIANGTRTVEPRTPFARVNRDWVEWHARLRRRPARAPTASTPLVSIVLTHFNRPRLLAEALASIRRQDYPALEVVLVDDGSDAPDAVDYLASLEVEFAHRGWCLVRQPNGYLGAARNAGIRAARGTYVLFMDDDNVAEPHEVSTFVRAAEASGADILTCFLRVFQHRDGATSDEGTYCWPFLGPAVAPGVTRNSFGDANAFVRRTVFDRLGGFTEDVGVGCEDWEFFARATLLGCRLMVVPEPLVRYRQTGSGMLSTTSQHANRMRALRPYFRHVPPPLRGLLHLAHGPAPALADTPATVPRLDHVRRAVVFGAGEGGRIALRLAERCGWTVPYLVDNNAGLWNTRAHGLGVRPPTALEARDFDLVIVASMAGKSAIFRQLERLGLSHAEHFVHFLEPVSVTGVTAQASVS